MRADRSLTEDPSNGAAQNRADSANETDIKSFFIPGEEVQLNAEIENGLTVLTNYRVCIKKTDCIWIFFPLKSIETIESVNPTIKILCRDVKIYEICFRSENQFSLWESKLQEASRPLSDPETAFAFTFYNSVQEHRPQLFQALQEDSLSYEEHMEVNFMNEYRRLGFESSNGWRISNVNNNYALCKTYPTKVIVPESFNDEDLQPAADFRMSCRFPVAVWRHSNGAVLARSSQPSIGIFFNRCAMDERLVDNINQACCAESLDETTADVGPLTTDGEEKRMLVLDCRSLASAFANRVGGGGYENVYNYRNADLQHMNIPNIHSVHQAYSTLRAVLFSLTMDGKRLLRNEEWYDAISNIMFASNVASEALNSGRPVLVHCSDGWDRTPQITSLTAILLDPFYRTIEGFQVLVEREFIDFGHKFAERHEVIATANIERSPVFLQFLECVYQLILQFPTHFEFNNEFLMKLGQHIYSHLFGDFLFNSSSERAKAKVRSRCFSVWCLFKLNRSRYINILYFPETQTLKPSALSVNMVIWKPFYNWFTNHMQISNPNESVARRSYSSDFELVEAPEIDTGILGQVVNSLVTLLNFNTTIQYPVLPVIDEDNYSPALMAALAEEPHDFDGLNFIVGEKERTLLENTLATKTKKIEHLESELKRLSEIQQQILLDANKQQPKVADKQSSAESADEESQEEECVVVDSSWETVEAAEKPATWTPDHAAIYCMDCKTHFWTGVRKHHCRGCGKVFCHECTKHRLPVPKENLHLPVRVCRSCVDCQASPPRSPPMAVST